MKNFGKYALVFAVAAMLCGCQNVIMHTGKYTGTERGEFAMVYKNLIFLRVKASENIPGALTFWEWAGKYRIDTNTGMIHLDMDDQILKLWKYSYNIYADRNVIILEDLGENKRYNLLYEHPVLRSRPANAPIPFSSSGSDPVYKTMPPIEE